MRVFSLFLYLLPLDLTSPLSMNKLSHISTSLSAPITFNMTSPSSTASSSIPGDAYFADLYPLYSPVHSRSPSPVYCPLPPPPLAPSFAASPESMGRYPNRKNKRRHCGDDNNNNLHRSHGNGHGNGHGCNTGHKPYHKPSIPPPFRPRLEFSSAPAPAATTPYRPGLSFLSTDGSSAAGGHPLTPESPVGGMGEEKCIPHEVCVKEEKEEDRGDRISAQKMRRRAQNRDAQRAFRARQMERVAELEKEVEELKAELEVLRARVGGGLVGDNRGVE